MNLWYSADCVTDDLRWVAIAAIRLFTIHAALWMIAFALDRADTPPRSLLNFSDVFAISGENPISYNE